MARLFSFLSWGNGRKFFLAIFVFVAVVVVLVALLFRPSSSADRFLSKVPSSAFLYTHANATSLGHDTLTVWIGELFSQIQNVSSAATAFFQLVISQSEEVSLAFFPGDGQQQVPGWVLYVRGSGIETFESSLRDVSVQPQEFPSFQGFSVAAFHLSPQESIFWSRGGDAVLIFASSQASLQSALTTVRSGDSLRKKIGFFPRVLLGREPLYAYAILGDATVLTLFRENSLLRSFTADTSLPKSSSLFLKVSKNKDSSFSWKITPSWWSLLSSSRSSAGYTSFNVAPASTSFLFADVSPGTSLPVIPSPSFWAIAQRMSEKGTLVGVPVQGIDIPIFSFVSEPLVSDVPTTLKRWEDTISAELRLKYPERAAYTLPDQSVSYELVAASAVDRRVIMKQDIPFIRLSRSEKEAFFLGAVGDRVLFTSSEALVDQMVPVFHKETPSFSLSLPNACPDAGSPVVFLNEKMWPRLSTLKKSSFFASFSSNALEGCIF